MAHVTTLSSRMTFFYKVIFPVVWITGFGAGAIAMWMSSGPPAGAKWWFLAAWCFGASFICLTCVPLKRVRTDGSNLYLSNYQEEITIPASLIDRVTESRWINIHPVTIHLRAATEFGSKVMFMPKSRFAFNWMSHPVVGEIERLAQNATTGSVS